MNATHQAFVETGRCALIQLEDMNVIVQMDTKWLVQEIVHGVEVNTVERTYEKL